MVNILSFDIEEWLTYENISGDKKFQKNWKDILI